MDREISITREFAYQRRGYQIAGGVRMPEARSMIVDGTPMRWIEEGTGPPVVFIHGIPTGPELWRHVLPLIPQARCLAWEMIGYASSMGGEQGRDISVAHQADYLLAWLGHLGIDRAVLVGHDLGGGAAQIAAVRRPDRCAGLVLVNSVSYDSWPIPSVKAMRVAGGLVARLPNSLFRLVIRAFIHRGHDIRSRASESSELHWAPYAVKGGAASFVRQIRSLDSQDTLSIAEALPSLNVPAKVVWGAADRFQKLSFGERLAHDLDAPLMPLDGALHFVPEDHPDAVAEAVRDVVAASGTKP